MLFVLILCTLHFSRSQHDVAPVFWWGVFDSYHMQSKQRNIYITSMIHQKHAWIDRDGILRFTGVNIWSASHTITVAQSMTSFIFTRFCQCKVDSPIVTKNVSPLEQAVPGWSCFPLIGTSFTAVMAAHFDESLSWPPLKTWLYYLQTDVKTRVD